MGKCPVIRHSTSPLEGSFLGGKPPTPVCDHTPHFVAVSYVPLLSNYREVPLSGSEPPCVVIHLSSSLFDQTPHHYCELFVQTFRMKSGVGGAEHRHLLLLSIVGFFTGAGRTQRAFSVACLLPSNPCSAHHPSMTRVVLSLCPPPVARARPAPDRTGPAPSSPAESPSRRLRPAHAGGSCFVGQDQYSARATMNSARCAQGLSTAI